jgi:hypothetical protein
MEESKSKRERRIRKYKSATILGCAKMSDLNRKRWFSAVPLSIIEKICG